jgi:hypothetical protein
MISRSMFWSVLSVIFLVSIHVLVSKLNACHSKIFTSYVQERNATSELKCPWSTNNSYLYLHADLTQEPKLGVCLKAMLELKQHISIYAPHLDMFFTDGVALGAFRNGGFIPGETDVDTYVQYPSSWKETSIAWEFILMTTKLLQHLLEKRQWLMRIKKVPYGFLIEFEFNKMICKIEIVPVAHTCKTCSALFHGETLPFRVDTVSKLSEWFGDSFFVQIPEFKGWYNDSVLTFDSPYRRFILNQYLVTVDRDHNNFISLAEIEATWIPQSAKVFDSHILDRGVANINKLYQLSRLYSGICWDYSSSSWKLCPRYP